LKPAASGERASAPTCSASCPPTSEPRPAPISRVLQAAGAGGAAAGCLLAVTDLLAGERTRIGREGKRRRVRRRRRFEFGFGAVAATAAAAVLLALVIFNGGSGSNNSQQVSFHSLPRGVAIAATLQPRPFGTQIRMDVSGIRSGTLCRVFLRRANGTRVPAGSFRYRYGAGRDAAMLTSALDLSAARAVGVQAGSRTFTAPLHHGVGAEASSNPKTTEKEYS